MKIWKFIKKVMETEEKSSKIPQEEKETGQPEKIDEQGKKIEDESGNIEDKQGLSNQPSENNGSEAEASDSSESESSSSASQQENQSSNQIEQTSNSENNQQSGTTTKQNDNIETPEDNQGSEGDDSTQGSSTGDDQGSDSSTKQSKSQEIEEKQSSQENSSSSNTSQDSSSNTETSKQTSSTENSQETENSTNQSDISETLEENQSSQNEMSQQSNNESIKNNQSSQSNPQVEEQNEIKKNNSDSEYDEEEEEKIEDEKTKKEKIKPQKEKNDVEESEETPHELSEESNNFLSQLSELPSFEDRNRGNGYSIDTKSKTEIPESVVRTLITKFLNQRFCRKSSDLNIRSNSLEKSDGFYKWEVKDVIIHSKTHQLNKVLNDKYSYEYAEGQGDNVPLSFYFDMSGSMSSYTNMLATIAIELLKKNVKVLIGFNERVNVQIDSIDKNITVEELSRILTSAGYSNWGYSNKEHFIKDSRVKFKYIDRNINNYLFEKKAEKCVVFSDFDPLSEVVNLSQKVQTYWFCFERNFDRSNLNKYNGFLYSVQNPEDILEGLVMVNGKRFETLCYVDNPKQLQKRRS